jgi:DNA (cytosine-5)-methyltransferase 1
MPRYPFPKFAEPTPLIVAPGAAVKVTAVTLFSGIGSFSKALREMGFHTLSHDFMPESCASLNANGFNVVQGDIRQVDFTDPVYAHAEVVAGGPPCQPFSQSGRNAGVNDPRDMIPEFQRAVAQIFPRFFVLENVRGLASPRHRAYLDRRVAEFEAMGYYVEWRVLDAADHGVAQSRKRIFILGTRIDVAHERFSQRLPIVWPRRTRQITMAEALGWDAVTCMERNQLAPVPAWDKDASQWPLERPSTTVIGSFMPEVQAAPGYRQAGDGPRQNAPGSVVTTPEERLVLQGFPKDWKVLGSRTKRDLQIGNSCPTTLTKALLAPNVR